MISIVLGIDHAVEVYVAVLFVAIVSYDNVEERSYGRIGHILYFDDDGLEYGPRFSEAPLFCCNSIVPFEVVV